MKMPVFEAEKKIALGVSCNNNSEEELTRALDPWIGHVDYIIAVEGRYRVPYSPTMMRGNIPPKFGNNTLTILEDHYDDKVQIVYDEYYGVQHDKRQRYFDIAGRLNCDALIVFDTDEIIMAPAPLHSSYKLDWDKFYRRIALAHEFMEGEPGLLDMTAWIPTEAEWSRQFNKVPDNTWWQYHKIHLNPGKQRYALNHYTFAYKDATDEQIAGFTADRENIVKKNPFLLYPLGICEGVRITTDRKLRNKEQNDYGNTWTWQWMQEETYRAYLLELKSLADKGDNNMRQIYEQHYREPFSYFFDNNARPVMYTKEEKERFEELEL